MIDKHGSEENEIKNTKGNDDNQIALQRTNDRVWGKKITIIQKLNVTSPYAQFNGHWCFHSETKSLLLFWQTWLKRDIQYINFCFPHCFREKSNSLNNSGTAGQENWWQDSVLGGEGVASTKSCDFCKITQPIIIEGALKTFRSSWFLI